MMPVRHIRRFPSKEMVHARHDALLVLVAAERKGARLVDGGDRVGSEIVVSVGHEAQRRKGGLVSAAARSATRRGLRPCRRWRFARRVATLPPRSCVARQEPYIPGALSIL